MYQDGHCSELGHELSLGNLIENFNGSDYEGLTKKKPTLANTLKDVLKIVEGKFDLTRCTHGRVCRLEHKTFDGIIAN